MENEVKGTKYDVGNNGGNCKYYCDSNQYHCHFNQYYTDYQSKKTSKKQPLRPKLGCFFDKTIY